jgi:hypothetical protein
VFLWGVGAFYNTDHRGYVLDENLLPPSPGLCFLKSPPSVQFLWGALLWDFPNKTPNHHDSIGVNWSLPPRTPYSACVFYYCFALYQTTTLQERTLWDGDGVPGVRGPTICCPAIELLRGVCGVYCCRHTPRKRATTR